MALNSDMRPMPARHYKRPPIVEAVINIQVTYPGGLSESLLDKIDARFSSRFMHKLKLSGVDVTLNGGIAEATAPSVVANRIIGLRFANQENNRILQVRPEGFAFSHLTPYSTWEELRSEALPFWNEFLEICQPTAVTRIAVRFINRLHLPQSLPEKSVQLEDFLTFSPNVPDEFEVVTGFMSQVQLPLRGELSGQRPLALVTVASQPPSIPETELTVLDIDVFETVNWPPNDPLIWEELEKMRGIKNRIFEAALTDRMKETFS